MTDRSTGRDAKAIAAQLSAVVRQPGVPPEKIRELVCALVDKMKAEGAPPEKVVIAVKQVVLQDIAIRATKDPVKGPEKLLEQALSWCIGRYYGSGE